MLPCFRLLLIVLFGSAGLLEANAIKLEAVAATAGNGSGLAEAVDGVETASNGWRASQSIPQSAVFRCLQPVKSGRLITQLSFDGTQGDIPFREFSIAVTTDPNPSLASRWEPVFPVLFDANGGAVTFAGEHLCVVGDSARTSLRMDVILPFDDVTGLRIDVYPAAGKAAATALLTELRAERKAILTTNVALGCPVTASHALGPKQSARFLTDGLAHTYAHPGAPDLGEQFFFEIDLRRVLTIDHLSLRSRVESNGGERFSRLILQLFDEKPTADSVPAWTAIRHDEGTYQEPGARDIVRAAGGQGDFRGRYLRISSSSPVPFSPQVSEVEVYESIVVPNVTVKANDRPLTGNETTRIPSTTNWLAFTLANPELHDHLSLVHRWRIAGFNKEWLLGDSKGVIESRGLPVGEYLFEVQLRHTDFQWNEAGLRLPFAVLTPWWQKPATQIGAVLLLVIVVALIVWRLARRRMFRRVAELERTQELANERRRIARDMHDVVGARLTQLTVMHELFAAKHALPEEAQSQLRELTKTTNAVVAAFDETVWAVNPRNDTLQNLADYLCHAASDYLRPLDITCRQDVQEDLPDKAVGAQKRHALLLAFKEALQNVAKHAEASFVTLTLRLTGMTFLILLDDNGRGLPSDLTGTEKDGLENMSSRLAEVGGMCVIEARPEGGTRVEMRLNLES